MRERICLPLAHSCTRWRRVEGRSKRRVRPLSSLRFAATTHPRSQRFSPCHHRRWTASCRSASRRTRMNGGRARAISLTHSSGSVRISSQVSIEATTCRVVRARATASRSGDQCLPSCCSLRLSVTGLWMWRRPGGGSASDQPSTRFDVFRRALGRQLFAGRALHRVPERGRGRDTAGLGEEPRRRRADSSHVWRCACAAADVVSAQRSDCVQPFSRRPVVGAPLGRFRPSSSGIWRCAKILGGRHADGLHSRHGDLDRQGGWKQRARGFGCTGNAMVGRAVARLVTRR